MKIFLSFLIPIALLVLILQSFTTVSQSKQEYLPPCCNIMDPRNTTGQYFSLDCATGHLPAIDSQCCVNLWVYFNGPPPATISCNAEGMFCPEQFH